MHKKYPPLLLIPWLILSVLACNFVTTGFSLQPQASDTQLPALPQTAVPTHDSNKGGCEVPVQEISLKGRAAKSDAEISGLTWYGDDLILLPQYPKRMGGGEKSLIFRLPKKEILNYLQGDKQGALEPLAITFIQDGLDLDYDSYEGYEAITFHGEQAFLTIEMGGGASSVGYLVAGEITPDLSKLTLAPDSLTLYYPALNLKNMSDETLFIQDGSLYSLYEVNGALNATPYASQYDFELNETGTIPFPHLEYRLTDATSLDADNRFWVINYFFPGEEFLKPEIDPLVEAYPPGPSHQASDIVERLVEFQFNPDGIRFSDAAPIQLALQADGNARNWEGIVRLDDLGFLIVTDKFPKTIFGFVPYP